MKSDQKEEITESLISQEAKVSESNLPPPEPRVIPPAPFLALFAHTTPS